MRPVWGILVFCAVFYGAITQADQTNSTNNNSASEPSLCLRALQSTQEKVATRYKKIDPKRIVLSPNEHYPTLINGFDEKKVAPQIAPGTKPEEFDSTFYDFVIVGGGPAGLTAGLYLTDAGKKVLVLEQAATAGGLASGLSEDGVESGIGSAYSSGPYGQEEHAMYRHIGFKDVKKTLKIFGSIDSFLWKGKLYVNFWEDPAVLKQLPASFELFKDVLEWSDDNYMDDVDLPQGQFLDGMTINEFVRKMPQIMSKMTHENKKYAECYQRFLADPRLDRDDPMKDVLELIQLYTRSALGGTSAQVSAAPFGDFYISELGQRYTGTLGTGTVMKQLLTRLSEKDRDITIRTGSSVAQISQNENAATITYVKDGKLTAVAAKYVIFAASIKMAPKVIENFAQVAPVRQKMIDSLPMAHYLVHTVRVKGHPFRASYDLWLRDDKYVEDGELPDPTDVIMGRWMDPKIKGYEKYQDFSKPTPDDRGILTIYQPLGSYYVGKGLTEEQTLKLSEHAVKRVKEMLEPYTQKTWGTSIDVELVETQRWPFSIHIVKPGYLLDAQTLKKPLGRIFFGNNTLNIPELETAMIEGKHAAEDALEALREANRR